MPWDGIDGADSETSKFQLPPIIRPFLKVGGRGSGVDGSNWERCKDKGPARSVWRSKIRESNEFIIFFFSFS